MCDDGVEGDKMLTKFCLENGRKEEKKHSDYNFLNARKE